MGLSRLYVDWITGEQFSIQNVEPEEKRIAFLRGAYRLLKALGDELPSLELAARMSDNDYFDMVSDQLAEWAPQGYYFGENRHENGVFGFWPVPENFWEVR